MRTCISQRNVIVSENSILQNFIENISNFCFRVYFLSLVALLAFVYLSEMMNCVIGPVSPKFSPAVLKECKGGSEGFEKREQSMSATMVGRRKKF